LITHFALRVLYGDSEIPRSLRDSGSQSHLPPKSLRNDLKTRPGKENAFWGTPWNCWANGHCSPPWTWQAPVGTLSAGKSMSYAVPADIHPVVASWFESEQTVACWIGIVGCNCSAG